MSAKRSIVSILMPVKNAGPFLHDCITSILSQSETSWELLAVDDGSSDDSRNQLDAYAKHDKRFIVLKNEGNGIISALGTAYAKSSGSFITRMDSDDRMAPDKLEALKRNLSSYGQGHIAIGQVKYFSEGVLGDGYRSYEAWLNALTATGSNYREIYRECVIPSPCWMVYREDLDACRAFEPDTYPEDYDLCFRFWERGLKPIPSTEVLHYWRDHASRSSRTDPNYADNRFLELKLRWFLELDRNSDRPLVLWGAGNKGKALAQMLVKSNLDFHWVCNNEKKIGKNIYGKALQAVALVEELSEPQLIIAVANKHEQHEIRQELLDREAFFFC